MDSKETGPAAKIEDALVSEVNGFVNEKVKEEARPSPYSEASFHHTRNHVILAGESLQCLPILLHVGIPTFHTFLHNILSINSYL